MDKFVANIIDPSQAKSANTRLIAVCIFAGYFLISLIHIGSPAGDEAVFHYPNVLNFYKNGWSAIFNSSYSAANTPLPYMIIAALGKIFYPSVLLARIVTCILSLFSFLSILQLFIRLKLPAWYALAILFYPYFFVNSFIFYVMNYGVFFMSVALLIIIKNCYSVLDNLLIGIFLSMATLCQQFYIVIPAAIILSRLIFFYWANGLTSQRFLAWAFESACIIAPLIFPLMLFIKWGGLTHPNFRMHSISFYPSTWVAILFITGIYSIPFLVQFIKAYHRFLIVGSLLASIILVLFFKPVFLNKQGPGLFTGITLHLIDTPRRMFPALSNILLSVFTWFGLLTVSGLVKKAKSVWDYVLLLSWVFLAFVYSTNTLIGERHILPLMIILFLMMLPHIKSVLAIRFIVVLSIVGTSYFIYWNFIKFASV